MKLNDYLNLRMPPITPTVEEAYLNHTIIIEYKDGEIAKIENDAGGVDYFPKVSLKDFIESESTNSFESPEEYLTGSFDKDEILTEIFQKVNPFIEQVWTAPY